jgi:hypothetical protein
MLYHTIAKHKVHAISREAFDVATIALNVLHPVPKIRGLLYHLREIQDLDMQRWEELVIPGARITTQIENRGSLVQSNCLQHRTHPPAACPSRKWREKGLKNPEAKVSDSR